MAGSTKSCRIGVIAEEDSDVEVLRAFTSKLVVEARFSIRKFVGHGCGKLRRKAGVWAENLIAKGCSCIVVIHDSDGRDPLEIREELLSKIEGVGGAALVLVPVVEMEAWLLVDAHALQQAFNMRRVPKVPGAPSRLADPKAALAEIVRRGSSTRYLNTVHNVRIASHLNMSSLRGVESFELYPQFLASLLPNAWLL